MKLDGLRYWQTIGGAMRLPLDIPKTAFKPNGEISPSYSKSALVAEYIETMRLIYLNIPAKKRKNWAPPSYRAWCNDLSKEILFALSRTKREMNCIRTGLNRLESYHDSLGDLDTGNALTVMAMLPPDRLAA